MERGGDVPHAGRVPPGLLRLGASATIGPRDHRPAVGRGDRSDLGVLGPHLRGAPGVRLAAPPGLPDLPQAGRPHHARARLDWRLRAPPTAHHHRRPRRPCRAGPGRPGLQPRRPGCHLGWRHHLHPHRGGLAVPGQVIDLFSRRVIGWGVADHLRTPLVASALGMAVATRGGQVDGVVFHSDRGCQYTSGDYRQLCERLRVTQSMGATGICFDNSPAEAFFATLKRELVHRRRFATRAEARREIIRWIEGWYNARRLHSSIAYLTPNEKEATWHTDRLAA
ncbi:MAG TPA: IS3 family transposase [Acidimicrobiales bacterium]|nr:IS3 family transposase [Acidimicrobiales bacterium]